MNFSVYASLYVAGHALHKLAVNNHRNKLNSRQGKSRREPAQTRRNSQKQILVCSFYDGFKATLAAELVLMPVDKQRLRLMQQNVASQ